MKVLKFGGTSIGTVPMMKAVAKLVSDNEKKIVVLSAMAGTTNELVETVSFLYHKKADKAIALLKKMEQKYNQIVDDLYRDSEYVKKGKVIIEQHFSHIRSFTQDVFTIHEEKAILAQGELISTALFQLLLEEMKVNSVLLPALNFMRIDTNAEPDNYYIKVNLLRELEQNPDCDIFVTQGYICRNLYGEIDNLKRGGSDYSASLIGAAIGAEEIQIWTDIDGMHNNDPRFVENTRPLDRLSFDEAAELAYFGAKILHPLSILPAKVADIPVRLKNTMNPTDSGTLINGKAKGKGIKAVAAKDGITVIKIKSGRMLLAFGFLRKVFEIFERYKTPIDMITTSEVAVSITVDDTTNLENILKELEDYGNVEVNKDQTIICIVGENIVEQKGIINNVFDALKHFTLRMISYGGSRHNISMLVNSSDKKSALVSLNKIFE